MSVNLIKAKIEDLDFVEELLRQNDLPYQDVKNIGKEFFLAYDNSLFIGIIGLEKFDNIALLRSMVIEEKYRNKGYGKQLFAALIEESKKQGIEEFYLLTTTAKDFFEKIGFKTIERNSAPDAIKNTTEFLGLCPVSAVCLKINT